jgi:hypothetical protein
MSSGGTARLEYDTEKGDRMESGIPEVEEIWNSALFSNPECNNHCVASLVF